MATVMKPGWSKPSTILFASEIPANQKAFAFALAQAKEFGANLILFHAYDTLVVAASETSGSATTTMPLLRARRNINWNLWPSKSAKKAFNARWLCGPDWRPTRCSPSHANARSTGS